MSYTTWYSLNIEPIPNDDNNSIWKEELNGLSIINMTDGSYESRSWDERIEEMIELSTKYPDLLFTITAEGEDRYDNWKEYFRDGRYYHHDLNPVSFPDFDENLLEEPE